jgi:basic membrane protein A
VSGAGWRRTGVERAGRPLRIGRSIAAAAVIVAAGLVLSACAGSGPSGDSQAEEASEAQLAQTNRRLRVALVPSVAAPYQVRQLALKGLQDAISRFRLRGRVIDAGSARGYAAALAKAAAGSDFVMSMGSDMADATWRAAKAHPDTMFAIVDHRFDERRLLPNLESLVFDDGQAGYLVGYLAGMMTRSGVVSTIGAPRTARAERLMAGFVKGASDARRGVRALVGFAERGRDCRRVASAHAARRADVIFAVPGPCGLNGLEAAREAGIWGVGVDVDQAHLGPHVLSSAVRRYDAVVFDAVQGAANGAVEASWGTMAPYGLHGGGVSVYGVNYGGVALGPVSPAVAPRLLARIAALRRSLVGGQVVIPERV